jgi:hypothetical protein
MTRLAWLLPLSAAFGLLTAPANAQQKLPTAAEVMGKLKEKRDSGGVWKYKLEFETTGLQGGKAAREEWDFQIDWKTGKFRKAGSRLAGSGSFESTKVYDGEKIKTRFRYLTEDGKPVGDGAWKYGMLTGQPNSWNFQSEWWPVFFHKGVIAGLNDRYYPSHLVFDADAEKFFVSAEVLRNGRKCISLKTFPDDPVAPSEFEYFIDPKKDYAVVGFRYMRSNAPIYSLDIDVGETKKPGHWAVRGWTRTQHGDKGRPEQVCKVKVKDFAEDVKVGEDNAFDIVPPEGTAVGRSHYEGPEAREYETRKEYWYEVKNGKLIQTSGPEPPLWDRVRENWYWFALTAGLLAAAAVGSRGWLWGRMPGAPFPS